MQHTSSDKRRQSTIDGFGGRKAKSGKLPKQRSISPAAPTGRLPAHTTPPTAPQPFPKYFSAYAPVPQPTPSPLPPSKPAKAKKRWKKVVKRSLLALLVLILGVGGWLGWKGFYNFNKVFHGNLVSDAQALFGNTKLKGEDQGRVNILLAGNSADDPHHAGAQLTDSIMLISIDTQNNTGFMLSIPRDLWVDNPSVGHEKINAANNATDFSAPGYPNGGMGQLEQIVQEQLGIPINYYALIDYSAFRDAVNAVGGINVTIQSPDPRGLYDPNIAKVDGGPLKLPNGLVTLNGQTALNLARARGDAYGAYGFPQADFNRTEHQRQMLIALEQKASSAGVLTNPDKLSQLFDALGKNVITDLKAADALRAAKLSKNINIANLQSLTLGIDGNTPLLVNYTAADGEAALIPRAGIDNFGEIQQYYQKLTSNNPVVKESPSIVILNGSDVVGLAHKEELVLQPKGFNVAGIADANSVYPGTMIVDTTKGQKTASLQALQQLFPGTTTTSTSSGEALEARAYTADFIVILGQNWDSGH